MERKEKRDLILSMCLGDGCLAYTSNRISAAITIGHCKEQQDYLQLKADFLERAFDQKVRVRKGQDTKVQLSLCKKRFKAWRKFIYRNGKKDLSLLLPFIINPQRAISFWLMDDGYTEPSFDRNKAGENIFYSACLRIFTCDQSLQTHEYMIDWFYKNFSVTPKVLYNKSTKRNKTYPFLKFNTVDSLIIWEQIRTFVMITDSMKHKFRYMEQYYQKKLSQRTTSK
jgi:hypothetical protein